jgi:diguanylate cyclase (GGDEF)-like protein/PAS domain S-box-containing protein
MTRAMDTLRTSRRTGDGANDAAPGRNSDKGLRTWRARAWILYLSLGVLATGIYFLLPSAIAKNLLYGLIGLSAVGAIVVGFRLHRPIRPLPWWLFAAGLLLSICGDAVWSFYEGLLGVKVPFPSVADIFYLAGYPLIGVGLASMVRNRAPQRAWTGLVDATIVAVCAGILSWVFLMEPYADDPRLTLLERLVSVAYPLMDVLLLALLLRLLFLPGERPSAFYLLSTSMVLMLGADTAFAVAALSGAYQTGNPIDAGWLLCYVLWGAAALHPSMAALSEPIPQPEQRLTLRRSALLAATSLVVPGVLVVQALGNRINAPLIVVGWVMLFLLGAARVAGVISERQRVEEALLRRDVILQAVSFVAQRLIEAPDWRGGVHGALGRLGEAAGADRVHVFEARAGEDGTVLMSQLYEWTAPGVEPQIGNPELQELPLNGAGFVRWKEALSRGLPVHGHVSDLPESERAVLAARGVLSIAVVPVFVGREWWGFMGFEQCLAERDWTAGEVEALRTAARTMGAAIQRQRTQEALKESERRLSTLLSNAPAYLYRCRNEPSWPNEFVSDYAREITGYSPEELTDGNIMFGDLIVEEDRQRVWEEVQAALAERRRFGLRYAIRHKDGTLRYVEEHGQGVHNDDGTVEVLEGVVYDVTERERAEERLRETEARYRGVVEDQTELICRFSPDGTLTFVNGAYCRYFGKDREELIGHRFSLLILEGDRQAAKQNYASLSPENPTRTIEHRVVMADGEIRWQQWVDRAMFDERGEPLEYQSVGRDITERKRAEERLQKSERSLAEAQRLARLGSWEWDVRSGEAWWSNETFRIYGFEPGTLVPSLAKVMELVHPADKELLREKIDGALYRDEPYEFEHRIVRPSGEVRWVHRRAEVVRGESGEPLWRLGTIHDVTERKALEEQLEHQALHDSLTGLPNRTLFMDRLGQALSRAQRRGSRAAVLFMDLDNFKVINDSLGHEAGDTLLVAVAERLRTRLRPEDTAARLGGDEFVVLLEDLADEAEAVRVAERILDDLRAPFISAGREAFMTISVGIALNGAGADRPAELLRDADAAMYAAKEDGSLRVFEPSMYAQAMRRLELENGLRRAVEREEFEVCYQPQVGLQSGNVVGFEALVRWRHPERGLVSPSAFVPMAEETGLIVPIGRWVLEEACRQAKEWQRRHPCEPPLLISVNLSAKQLQRSDLAETVIQVLDETGLEARCLILDVTETALIEAANGTPEAVLRRLKRLGVWIAIDDFGTGYSSLSYLKRLPADILKVDKSFVDRLGDDAGDTALVQLIIDTAHTLGMHVVAEGVQSNEQAELLLEMGCDVAQGNRFSQPLPSEAVPVFLADASLR